MAAEVHMTPGVYFTWVDDGQVPNATPTSTGAVVFQSPMGSLLPTYVGSQTMVTQVYNNPNPSYGGGVDTLYQFMQQGPGAWGLRVPGTGSEWALGLFANNMLMNGTVTTSNPNGLAYDGTSYMPIYEGSETDFTQIIPYVYDYVVSESMLANNTIGAITITAGTHTGVTTSVVFTYNHGYTMQLLAQAIQTALDGLAPGGGVMVVPRVNYPSNWVLGDAVPDPWIVRIYAPPTAGALTFEGGTITGGSSQPTVLYRATEWLFVTIAENPGLWATPSGIAPTAVNLISNGVGTQQQVGINFTGAIQAGQSIIANINGTTVGPVAYTVNNNDTLAAFATAIEEAFPTSITATVQPALTAGPANNRVVVLQGADWTVSINVTQVSVLFNGGFASGHFTETGTNNFLNDDTLLMDTTTLTIVDTIGTAAGNVLEASTFAGTVANISAALAASISGGPNTANYITPTSPANVSVAAVTGGFTVSAIAQGTGGNSYNITYTAAGTAAGSFSATTLQNGAAIPSPISAYISQIITAAPPSFDGTLQLFQNNNLATPVEQWNITLANQLSGYNLQLNVEQQVNNGSTASKYIRVVENPLLPNGAYFFGQAAKIQSSTIVNQLNQTGYLQGGADGAQVTSTQIIQGWMTLLSNQYTLRIIMNGGYSTQDVHQYLALFSETRRDCVAILDMDASNQQSEAAAYYRQNVLNLNTSYAAIYTPDVMINDLTTGLTRYVCPSGFVGSAYAYTDKVAFPWFAAAGLNRGVINVAAGLRYYYGSSDTDLLAAAQVNPIIMKEGTPTIWGEQTLYYNLSPFQSMPVRRMLNQIEIQVTDTVATSLFEPNDDFTREAVNQECVNVLEPIKNQRGIYRYEVVDNDLVNSNLDVSDRDLNVLIIIDPVLSILRIKVLGVVTQTGASFSEVITQYGNQTGSTLS
jgi:hypothetical protein